MSTTLTLTDLDRIGRIIDTDGLDAVPAELLAGVVRDASLLGVRPIATAVFASIGDPTVARVRAFGRIAPGIARAVAA